MDDKGNRISRGADFGCTTEEEPLGEFILHGDLYTVFRNGSGVIVRNAKGDIVAEGSAILWFQPNLRYTPGKDQLALRLRRDFEDLVAWTCKDRFDLFHLGYWSPTEK
ncbi:hypothetical protein [Salininema proteolyticum]|uniref:Uncharacterized protein n=1 Tax=Salininema proteolyticum TaxID=1607685 RepID=A0ABV8U3C2_9ACTN